MTYRFSIDQINQQQQHALRFFQTFTNAAFDHAERLAQHNLSSARKQLESQVSHTSQWLASKDTPERLVKSENLAQASITSSTDYIHGLQDVLSSGNEVYIRLLEEAHSEWNKSLSSLFDLYAQSSPNSETALAAIKSAVSAANSAFENANKAARQVASITDANLKAASSATTRAIDATTASRKKAA